MDVSGDGQRIAVLDNLDDVTVYDLAERAPVAALGGEGTSYRAPRFSPDGTHLAVSYFNTECWEGCLPRLRCLAVRRARPGCGRGDLPGAWRPGGGCCLLPRGDMIAAVAPLPFFGPDNNVAVWHVDRMDEPMVR